jgi:hypothetical protein
MSQEPTLNLTWAEDMEDKLEQLIYEPRQRMPFKAFVMWVQVLLLNSKYNEAE